jgi:hypothetical protein
MEPYPVQFSVGEDNTVARWRPLVHWLLIIPHFLIWQALGSVVSLALVIVWFVVVFTGTLPAGLGNLTVMTLRYQNRMVAYLYGLTTSYPPFAFSDEANDPRDHDVVTDIDMQLEDRNRVTTEWSRCVGSVLWPGSPCCSRAGTPRDCEPSQLASFGSRLASWPTTTC